MWSLRLNRGERRGYPTVADAESYPYSADERARMAHARQGIVVGTPEQVRPQLEALVADYAVDEALILTITEDAATRLHSYELVAQAFGLA